jgi:hypothetical protein
MRIRPYIGRRHWGVIEWLLLSRGGFAQDKIKKTANSAVFFVSAENQLQIPKDNFPFISIA